MFEKARNRFLYLQNGAKASFGKQAQYTQNREKSNRNDINVEKFCLTV